MENTYETYCQYDGDISNDCEGCVYGGDYHFVDGECVERSEE